MLKKLLNPDKKYENFRWFFTSNGILVVGGKSDEQNEIVLNNFLKPNFTVLHTSEPGSPFMIIVSDNPDKKDMEESAIFCACFSKKWKSQEKLIEIDIFKGDQIYKNKNMKTGTFGVKGNKKTIKVKPELVLVIQRGKLRAVPKTTKEKKIVEITQGDMSKEAAADIISKKIKNEFNYPFTKEEIMSAIPSGNLEIK
jgi:hypothetical protein